MKKFAKIVSLIVCIVMLASVFAGCGQSNQKSNGIQEPEGRVKTDGSSFTFWGSMEGNTKNAGLSNNSEMMLYQEMEKRTGVKIKFIHPAEGTSGNEAFTAMLLDTTLPDIIGTWWENYPGGPQQAIEDGVLIALNDYLPKYAPDYWNYVKDGENRKAVTTDDGRYYGFNVLNLGETKGFGGLFVRKDKLDEWNMEIPQTIDDWTALFAKAKAEGFDKPYTAQYSYLTFATTNNGGFNTAYDVGKGFYVDDVDGKPEVVFGPFEDGFTEYVAQMQEWFNAGYIDRDFATVENDKVLSNMVNGDSIASSGYVGSGIGKILPAAQQRDPNFDLVACPYPSTADGHEAEFQICYNPATTHANAITTYCGNYEKAVEWCNYVYSQEGMVLQLFGIEGTHHNVEMRDDDGDGVDEKHYVYTDLITNPSNSGCNSVSEALYKYMLPCNFPGYNQHIDYLNGYYQYDQQKDAIITWNIAAKKEGTSEDKDNVTDTPQEHQLPTLSYTEEESSELSELTFLVQDELDAMLTNTIMGKNTIEQWEEAVETAKANGYERILEITNNAYDRYMKK